MIVWLASYPRSGNTLTRQLLLQTMGIQTHSIHKDRDIAANPHLASAVGHVSHEGDWPALRDHALNSDQLFVVKTHYPPEDDGKAIYVVRDGRASLVSFVHFLRDLYGEKQVDVGQLLEGWRLFGTWSGHLEAWQPLSRPNTLLVRFENLVADPVAEAARIAAFLGVAHKGTWANEFERLRALSPDFFRFGSNERNIAEISALGLQAFWSRNGGWMKRLRYQK